MGGSIARRCRSWMGSIDSRRARKRRNYCRRGDCWRKTEPHENNVGFSERSEVPIEPRLSEQWFLRYPKTKEALAVVRDHLIRFFPAALGESLRAMAREHSGLVHQPPDLVGASDTGVVPKSETGTETRSARLDVGLEPPPDAENWTQDPDTLDTWFSSWLWAYETMDAETRQKFYPTSRSRDRAGHHFLLGRAHDHRRA